MCTQQCWGLQRDGMMQDHVPRAQKGAINGRQGGERLGTKAGICWHPRGAAAECQPAAMRGRVMRPPDPAVGLAEGTELPSEETQARSEGLHGQQPGGFLPEPVFSSLPEASVITVFACPFCNSTPSWLISAGGTRACISQEASCGRKHPSSAPGRLCSVQQASGRDASCRDQRKSSPQAEGAEEQPSACQLPESSPWSWKPVPGPGNAAGREAAP
ncbi:uncharacterized protein V3H86_006020 isoform 2-T2 [Mergus octosetaceus]